MGELIKEIKVIDNQRTKREEILVLTESMIHYLEDNGKVIFQKKLDIEPMAIHTFNIEDKNYANNKLINIMYMISSHQDHILVYKGTNLAWVLK